MVEAIRAVCRQFVVLCRGIGLIGGATVAVDGSRFKAVNTRDKNYTPGAIRLRMEQVDASHMRGTSGMPRIRPTTKRIGWTELRTLEPADRTVWRRCARRAAASER